MGEFGRCRPRTQLDGVVGEQAGTDSAQLSQLPHDPIASLAQSFTQCNDCFWPFLAFELSNVTATTEGFESGADVRRKVLAREGRAGGDEVGGCALENNPAAVVAGARAEVDEPVGVRHDRLVMLDGDH